METSERIQRLEAILAGGDQDPLTYFLLGREYMTVGRFAEGADTFEQCVRRNPQYSAAYRFLGDCHRKLGATARAREVYEAGISVANAQGDLQAAREMETLLGKLSPA
jgi:uncharacterized protein HemY